MKNLHQSLIYELRLGSISPNFLHQAKMEKSLISNTDFSKIANDLLEFNLEKTLGLTRTPRGVGGCVGCVGGWSGVKGYEECYRGCHGHSKPGFEIKFEITVFEVKPSSLEKLPTHSARQKIRRSVSPTLKYI